MPIYDKPPLTINEQVALLRERGLIIQREKQARELLATVGYYRFSGYWSPLLVGQEREKFIDGSTFESIYERYQFDSSMRQITLYAVNHVEVAFRASLSYFISHSLASGLWLSNSSNFRNKKNHARLIESITKSLYYSNDDFAIHYKQKYSSFTPVPPAWISLQLASLGDLVRIFEDLKINSPKSSIAERYKIDRFVLSSWLKSIRILRNKSAHHSPIWNRNYRKQPQWPLSLAGNKNEAWVSSWELPKDDAEGALYRQNRKTESPFQGITLYAQLCCALHLIDCINPNNTFRERITRLHKRFDRKLWIEAGFTLGWEKEPLWSLYH